MTVRAYLCGRSDCRLAGAGPYRSRFPHPGRAGPPTRPHGRFHPSHPTPHPPAPLTVPASGGSALRPSARFSLLALNIQSAAVGTVARPPVCTQAAGPVPAGLRPALGGRWLQSAAAVGRRTFCCGLCPLPAPERSVRARGRSGRAAVADHVVKAVCVRLRAAVWRALVCSLGQQSSTGQHRTAIDIAAAWMLGIGIIVAASTSLLWLPCQQHLRFRHVRRCTSKRPQMNLEEPHRLQQLHALLHPARCGWAIADVGEQVQIKCFRHR
jgi:hypothetical protein